MYQNCINELFFVVQIELGRFWETLSLLRVYYWSMHMQVPLKPLSKLCHITLTKSAESTDQDERQETYLPFMIINKTNL